MTEEKRRDRKQQTVGMAKGRVRMAKGRDGVGMHSKMCVLFLYTLNVE